MADAVLDVHGITKRYASIPAVKDVSFTIGSGDILGYLGANGAGKSTTVKMLAGLLEPTSGRITLNGANIFGDLQAYKRRLGYVPEQSDLYAFLSGWEYLQMVGTLRGLDRKRFERTAADLLQALTLYPHRHALIGSYSKGMRQRVVLIAALLHNPDVLILDEPFSGLDTTTALVLRKAVEMLARDGKAVFLSSPVLETMERICTHLVILKNGEIAASGSMSEIRRSFEKRDIEQVFLEISEQVDADQIARNIIETVREAGA